MDEEQYQNFSNHKAVVRGVSDPLRKFEQCLAFHHRSELWIAYIVNRKPSEKYTNSDVNHVEMAVTVLTDKGVPFELHMGISRGLLYINNGYSLHKGIAADLHAFAAKVMVRRDQSKRFLITTPLPMMKDLLVKTLPANSYWSGSNQKDSLISTQGEGPHSEDYEFSLKDIDGQTIFQTKHSEIDKYWWFFSNTQPSSSHPYLSVDLKKLASVF